MWQTGGGAKQSTRRGGSSLTEDSQTDRERQPSVYPSSCIMLTRNSSNDEEEAITTLQTYLLMHNKILSFVSAKLLQRHKVFIYLHLQLVTNVILKVFSMRLVLRLERNTKYVALNTNIRSIFFRIS